MRLPPRAPSEQEQPEFATLAERSRSASRALLALDPRAPPNAALVLEQISDPGVLVDLMVANTDLSVADKQAVLATAPVLPRLRLAVPLLEHCRDALAKTKGGQSPVPAPAPAPATWQELVARTQQVSLGPKEAMAASMRQLGKQVLFDGAAAPKGPLELPRRFDSGVLNQATGRVEVITVRSGALVHEPMGFRWHDRLEVRLRDFAWDQCALHTTGGGPAVEGALRAWFLRWFDVTDQLKPDARGFRGVVHSLDFISPNHATVDFGTAPPAAFEELLEALVKVGVTRVEFVGSHLPSPPALPPRE